MPHLQRLARSGGILAAALVLGYPLIAVPNVEPLTLAFFAVGCAEGPLWGLFVALVGESVFAAFHPMGPAIAPVWLAQVMGMGIVGVLGGWSRPLWRGAWHRGAWTVRAAWVGVLATLVFDGLTNFAFAIAIGPFVPVMIAAIPFAAVHAGSNALLFGLFFPILQRWLLRPTSVVAHSVPSP
ncbi:MAG TPA: hypothetical protein VGB22_05145 [candidate division Zixibacteria bacterium]|jgi:hypothetical protein